MFKDPKVVAIWILAIALIVVGVLYIQELKESDSLSNFSTDISEMKEEVREACADTTTDEGKEECSDALENTSTYLEDIR